MNRRLLLIKIIPIYISNQRVYHRDWQETKFYFMIAPDQMLPMQTTAHLKTSTWSCSVYRACIQDCSSSVISKATKDCTSFARIATIEEVSLIFQKNLQNTIFPGIFALTVAAARGLVLKAFRQILERTPYDEEIQIKQRSRRVLLQSVKWFTLFGVRRKVPKSAIFVSSCSTCLRRE